MDNSIFCKTKKRIKNYFSMHSKFFQVADWIESLFLWLVVVFKSSYDMDTTNFQLYHVSLSRVMWDPSIILEKSHFFSLIIIIICFILNWKEFFY